MFLFSIQSAERICGVGSERALPFQIGRELLQPAIEFAKAFLGAGFLALQAITRKEQALQGRGGFGFRFAQRRQAGRDLRLPRCRDRLLTGARGNDADGFVLGALRIGYFGFARPIQRKCKQQRFGAAHLSGNVAVAHRLPRLGLQ